MICINILLLILGVWQIYRGLEKQKLIDSQKTITYINLNQALNQPIDKILYKNTNIQGKFTAPTFFLYRSQNGQSGYWVVNPLYSQALNTSILIAHEFIKTKNNKQFLSLLELQNLYKTDTNTIQNLDNSYIISSIPRVFNLINDNYIQQNSLLVQNITPIEYKKHYNKNIVDFTLVKDNLPSLRQVNIMPDRHYGYASTWIGLFIVSLYFTYLSLKKNNK